jgi:hypothetical protein
LRVSNWSRLKTAIERSTEKGVYERIKTNYWKKIPMFYVPPDAAEHLALEYLGYNVHSSKGKRKELEDVRNQVETSSFNLDFYEKLRKATIMDNIENILKDEIVEKFNDSFRSLFDAIYALQTSYEGLLGEDSSPSEGRYLTALTWLDWGEHPSRIPTSDAVIANAFSLAYFSIVYDIGVMTTPGARQTNVDLKKYIDDHHIKSNLQEKILQRIFTAFPSLNIKTVEYAFNSIMKHLMIEWENNPRDVSIERDISNCRTLMENYVKALKFPTDLPDPSKWKIAEDSLVYESLDSFSHEKKSVTNDDASEEAFIRDFMNNTRPRSDSSSDDSDYSESTSQSYLQNDARSDDGASPRKFKSRGQKRRRSDEYQLPFLAMNTPIEPPWYPGKAEGERLGKLHLDAVRGLGTREQMTDAAMWRIAKDPGAARRYEQEMILQTDKSRRAIDLEQRDGYAMRLFGTGAADEDTMAAREHMRETHRVAALRREARDAELKQGREERAANVESKDTRFRLFWM